MVILGWLGQRTIVAHRLRTGEPWQQCKCVTLETDLGSFVCRGHLHSPCFMRLNVSLDPGPREDKQDWDVRPEVGE